MKQADKISTFLGVLLSVTFAFVFLQAAGFNDDPNSTIRFVGAQYTPKHFSQIPAPGAAIGTEYVVDDGMTCNVGAAVIAGGGVCKCVVMSDGVQWVAEFVLGLSAPSPSPTPTPGTQARASTWSCASGTSCALTLPTPLMNSDLIVCEINRASAVGALTYPTGYGSIPGTPVTYNTGASSVDHFAHRWNTGDTTTPAAITWTGASTASGSCIAAQNIPTSTLLFPASDFPYDVETTQANASAATSVSPPVTSHGPNDLVIYWVAAPAANTITNAITVTNQSAISGLSQVATGTASSANGSNGMIIGIDPNFVGDANGTPGGGQVGTPITWNLSPNAVSATTVLTILTTQPATAIPYAAQIPTMTNMQTFSQGPHIYNGHSHTVAGDGVTDDTAALQDAVIQGDVLIQPSTTPPPAGVCGNVPCYLIKGDISDGRGVWPAVWLPTNRQVRCTPDGSQAQIYNVNTATGVLTSVTPNPQAATLYDPYSNSVLPNPNGGNGASAIFRNQSGASGPTSGQKIFGCNFRGTNTAIPTPRTGIGPGSNWLTSGYEMGVWMEQASNVVIAGNDFRWLWGQGGVQSFGGGGTPTANNVKFLYNTAQHNGGYSFVWDNTSNSLFDHNITLDGGMGSELDSSTQTPHNNMASFNIVLADANAAPGVVSDNYGNTKLTEDCIVKSPEIDYSTDTFDHNIVQGFSGCNAGGNGGTCSTRCINRATKPPVTTNVTCNNGCIVP